MNNIKDLTDFYMWMVENDYDHNIRMRVEKKAEMYLATLSQGQILPIHNVVCSATKCMACEVDIKKDEGLLYCAGCGL